MAPIDSKISFKTLQCARDIFYLWLTAIFVFALQPSTDAVLATLIPAYIGDALENYTATSDSETLPMNQSEEVRGKR